MTARRDWLLQQLGITQWTLRRPAALSGEAAVALPPGVRLLMVADAPPPADHPLVKDVARGLGLAPSQLYGVTPEQVQMLPGGIPCQAWYLGLGPVDHPNGRYLTSPPLAALRENAAAKRDLWQQICRYEQDFLPEHR
ncbi:DNA polymerase III subunit psi [Martelella alba]|uniref:DNA polymerase III subunit psi n=1 Tax=Martelella alba TaxID=2590451 RepID=A0ABY2SQY1_9HYPH|nr:DNA polymerase III subunit psi [Martelella alba]TKI08625.1 DNA polymerase III subunit psi [Martelella alba]